MIPLELRNNKLISIMIRAFDLEYTNYKLEVIGCNNSSITSKETQKTIMPKFDIDRSQNELSNYLLSTSNSNFKYILKNKEENIDEFIVDMSELVFFARDLANSKITKYPIIIFEFTEGFFLPKAHYEVNFTYIENNSKIENKKQFTNQPGTKKEASFMALDKKFKEFDFFQRQNTINSEKKIEKINAFNDSISEKLTLMERHTANFEMMRNIDKMRKEIFYIEENINNNTNLIEVLKKNIIQKQKDIQLCSSILGMCKDNYNEKKNNLESEKKSIEKCIFRKEAIKLRKFADFSFIFFNQKCVHLYSIPVGFEIMFSKNSEEKIKFLERYNRDFSIMFGEIAIMVNHLAKLYDISLKFPLFINGSRSYILFGRDEFIPLYFIQKFGEKNMRFDLAISLLHSNLNQILLYFNVCSYKELKLFNIFSIFIRFYQYLQGVFTMNSFGQSKNFLDSTIEELNNNLCF